MHFTIFTGCYNSSNFIHRVFNSILNQTYANFEWIAIDDASNDNTLELLHDFKNDNPKLNITIIRREKNVGVAKNRELAISMAKGEFFITWDHDDQQLPDQLLIFKKNWETYGNDNVANLFAFCQDQHGNILGKQFPQGNHVGNYFTYFKDYLMYKNSEKQACTKTKLIKEYINFSFDEGKINDGDLLWAKLAQDYDFIFINEVVRVYYIEDSSNQMTKDTRTKTANSVYFAKKIWVNYFLDHIRDEKMLCLRIIFAMVFYGFLSNRNMVTIINEIKDISKKLIALQMIVPAKLLIMKMKVIDKRL